MVVEPVIAELVEALKRPQEKTNEDSGFDRLSHQGHQYLKIDVRALRFFIKDAFCNNISIKLFLK